jgi:branched-chain amino acid transport system substrate-binding protein
MRVLKLMIAGLAVLLALTATACSSSSSSTGGGSAPAASSTSAGTGSASTGAASPAAASGSDITIAVLCSCSGPFGQFVAPMVNVAQAWVDAANATGGIDGHQVKLISFNDGGEAGTALTQAQSAVNDKVDAILDASPLDSAWEKVVDTAKIPVVGGELNSSLYATDPNYYPSGQTPDSNGYSLVEVAKDAGAKTIGEIYCVEAPSCASLVAPIPQIGQSLGVPSVFKGSIAATAPNYTAQCIAAKSAGAQSMAVADVSSAIVKLGTDCNQQDYDPIYVTGGTGYAPSMAAAPGVQKNLWSAYPTLPYFSTAAPVKQMQQTVEKYYPGLQSGDSWSQVAVQAWTGMLLIQAAVKAAGSGPISAASITTGLNSLKNETLDGWSPPITFTAGQPHKVDCWFTADLKDGTPQVADGGKYSCMPAS